MSELTEPGGGVSFAQVRAGEYINLPRNASKDFLPEHADGLHEAVRASLARPDGLDVFFAAEVGLAVLPWQEERGLMEEDVPVVLSWREGFTDKLGFLKEVEDFVDPHSSTVADEKRVPFLIRNATATYLEMVQLAATVNRWSDASLWASQTLVKAELAMPDKTRAWQRWNNQAIEYTDGKIKRINDVLRQKAA